MTGSELATLDDYRAAGSFNVLSPVIELASRESAISPYLVESVAAVKISPEPRAGETYHDYRYANERDGLFALTGLGLAKIAAAAGIKWVATTMLERSRRPDGHVYVLWSATGAIRQPNGEWHLESASAHLDTADEAEALEDMYRRKLDSGRARFTELEIPAMVRREVLQIRTFAEERVETRAKNRVIRRVLALRQVYSGKELAQPFAVPRLIFRPDVADPLSLERVQLEGARARDELFGSPLPLGEPSSAPPEPEVEVPPEAPPSPPEPAPARESKPKAEKKPRATREKAKAKQDPEPTLQGEPASEAPIDDARPAPASDERDDAPPPEGWDESAGESAGSDLDSMTREQLLEEAARLFGGESASKQIASARMLSSAAFLWEPVEKVSDLSDVQIRTLVEKKRAQA